MLSFKKIITVFSAYMETLHQKWSKKEEGKALLCAASWS